MIGSIIFVKTSSPISWLIRKLCKSEWSHVALSISDNDDWILESDVLKKVSVRRNRYKDYKIVNLNISDREQLQLLSYLFSQYKKPYDYRQLLGLGLRILGLTTKENLWNSINRIICSELIDRAYMSISIDLVPNRQDGDVTPAQLANILLKENVVNGGGSHGKTV